MSIVSNANISSASSILVSLLAWSLLIPTFVTFVMCSSRLMQYNIIIIISFFRLCKLRIRGCDLLVSGRVGYAPRAKTRQNSWKKKKGRVFVAADAVSLSLQLTILLLLLLFHFFAYVSLELGVVICWLVVELGTPQEQRPGRTVERSKRGEWENEKRKGRGRISTSYYTSFPSFLTQNSWKK